MDTQRFLLMFLLVSLVATYHTEIAVSPASIRR